MNSTTPIIPWHKHITCAEAIAYAEQIKAMPEKTATWTERNRAARILGARYRLEEIPEVEYRLRRSHMFAMAYRDGSVILDGLRMLEPREAAVARKTPPARPRLRKLLACMGLQYCVVDDKKFLLRRKVA